MKLSSLGCVHNLSEICLKTTNPMSTTIYSELKLTCKMLSSMNSFSALSSWFKLQDQILPLECLWELQFHNLIQFTSYLYYNPDLIHDLSECFGERIWCEDETVRLQCSETVAGLLVVLVNLGVHTSRDIYKPGHQLLASVISKFVKRLLQDPASAEEPVQFLPKLLNSTSCLESRLRSFCTSLLQELMCCNPHTVTVEEAVQDQAKLYTSNKTPDSIKETFSVVVSKLTIDDVINGLDAVVTSQDQLNWRWLLTAVSIFAASSSSTGTEHLKGLIEKWLVQSCATKNADMLSAALLCARQCCVEDSAKFGSYSSWFGSLQVRPASAYTFFFNFLSQLVPYEPVLYLKIHVNKVPSAPTNCHSVVADYAALAKTRLADLNQTTDYIGLFSEYTTTEQEGREADVAKVISHFKQTKEVMKVVLEASVFRRQFYEKVFLADLLKFGDPERAGLVEKLFSMGKIPHRLYNRWCESKL